MISPAPIPSLSKQYSILSLLAYFDIFNHPLNQLDFGRLNDSIGIEFNSIMQELVHSGICFEWNGFYSLQAEVKLLVEKRKKAEHMALQYWPNMRRSAGLIANFPFVRGIAISGSLSKGVMADDADIDFFIITEPGKLWLTRTLLILYKKIMLLNSRKYFCINYFVDTQNLSIPDKNIFTAVEVAHLIPVYQENQLFDLFYQENLWVRQYLNSPAHIAQNNPALPFYWDTKPLKILSVKKIIEGVLQGSIGNRLEHWAHAITLKRWIKKFAHFSQDKFALTMRSTKGISKHHPHDFQSKVLELYHLRFDATINRYKSMENKNNL